MNCIDVADDAIWIGAAIPLTCICVEICKARGCEWRRFHMLPPEKFRRKDQQQSLDL